MVPSAGLAAAVAAAAAVVAKPVEFRPQKQVRVEWATPRSLESQFSRTLYVNNIKQVCPFALRHPPSASPACPLTRLPTDQ